MRIAELNGWCFRKCHSFKLSLFLLFSRIVVPFTKSCLMALPSVQAVWKSVTDVFIAPLYHSIGRCFASVDIRLVQE